MTTANCIQDALGQLIPCIDFPSLPSWPIVVVLLPAVVVTLFAGIVATWGRFTVSKILERFGDIFIGYAKHAARAAFWQEVLVHASVYAPASALWFDACYGTGEVVAGIVTCTGLLAVAGAFAYARASHSLLIEDSRTKGLYILQPGRATFRRRCFVALLEVLQGLFVNLAFVVPASSIVVPLTRGGWAAPPYLIVVVLAVIPAFVAWRCARCLGKLHL